MIQFGFSLIPVIIIFLCVSIVSLVLYRESGRYKKYLWILRMLSYLMVGIMVLKPVIVKIDRSKANQTLAIIVDVSESMKFSKRFDQIKDVLASKFIRYIGSDFKIIYYYFDSSVSVTTIDELLAMKILKGKKTEIGKALEYVHEHGADAIMLFSDGLQNGEKDPLLSSRSLGVPVYAYKMEDIDYIDIKIKDINIGEFAFKDTEIEADVYIESKGFEGKDITVVLEQGKRVVATERIILSDGVNSLTFRIIPEKTGVMEYSVNIPPYTTEVNRDNNSMGFSLNVLRDKIRVLYICGRPSWEYKFLRKILKDDPSVELVSFIILRNPDNITVVPENELSLIPFPASDLFSRDVYDFDILIFENFSYRRFFSVKLLDNIKSFVAKGGAFLFIGGENSFASGGYSGTGIEEILPVKMAENRQVEGRFKLKITNYNHPVVDLENDHDKSRILWNNAPDLVRSNYLLPGDGGSVLLGIHPAENIIGDEIPVLAVRDYFKGRVMVLGSNSTWRWAMKSAQKTGKVYLYERFWQKTIRWLIRSPELEPVKMTLLKDEYYPGEEIRIRVQVRDRYFRPISKADIKTSLLTPLKTKRILLPPDHTSKPGFYEGSYFLTEPGEYMIDIEVYDGQAFIGKGSKRLKVISPSGEDYSPVNTALLKEICDRTGGGMFSLGEDIKGTMDPGVKYRVLKKTGIWSKAYIYLILCVALGLEWFIRRKEGMW